MIEHVLKLQNMFYVLQNRFSATTVRCVRSILAVFFIVPMTPETIPNLRPDHRALHRHISFCVNVSFH
jgi:hypothetical protein